MISQAPEARSVHVACDTQLPRRGRQRLPDALAQLWAHHDALPPVHLLDPRIETVEVIAVREEEIGLGGKELVVHDGLQRSLSSSLGIISR